MVQVRGGMGIVNPVVQHPGTIGILATDGSPGWWIVSCYHVLCRLNRAPFVKGEEIRLADSTTSPDVIAHVDRALVGLDAAAGIVAGEVEVLPGIFGLPPVTAPSEPTEGMVVAKYGHATQYTEGTIWRVDGDDVWIRGGDDPNARLSAAGDSGAVWVARDTWSPVVLHTGTNDAGMIPYARGIRLLTALEQLCLEVILGG